MTLNELGALGSAIGGIVSTLSFYKDMKPQPDDSKLSEKRKSAINLTLEAARLTRVYLYDSNQTGEQDRIREADLSKVWLKASEALHQIDPQLCKIAQVKAFGWAEPNRWQELKQNVSTIKIDVIIEQCNYLLEEST
ncbi:hypothetical protein [Shewanella sp. 10N.286.48.A6]|uniref:hypothetical protein n=1 Tax=Shewanella sp. 10N.286.48.A6 TaxID=1880833 RepID=UPI000C84FCB9|nr:hypothetical protein [Shewanella sp. 10N.286.48.A6]PMH94916.1 hypothetical protein BCU55_19660 [Shewanella sp. 10N.286.48.A6]